MLDDLLIGAHLAVRLPGYLYRTIDLEGGSALIRRRIEEREASFLELAQRAIYAQPDSPYRALLEHAGCEPGDLVRLVQHEGVDGALLELLGKGVYLTIDEFKGRRPVQRGSLRLEVDLGLFRNPLSRQHIVSGSGGSRGPRLPVPLDLKNIYDRALHCCLPILARGGAAWRLAVWKVPGGALPTMLQHALIPRTLDRWFLMVDPRRPGINPRYRWSGSMVGWISRLAGRPVPWGECVSLDDPLPIARWLAGVLAEGRRPHLDTFPGAAVELCRAARSAGIDLAGASLSLAGEPLTAARLATIQGMGIDAVSRYSTSESGPLGSGCVAADVADEQHLLDDCHAIIQPGAAAGGALPRDALLVTSLRTSTSLVHLNVAFGDRAVLSERRCGCPLERVGWMRHMSDIRSYEKLTAHGMTFLDSDVIRVLEQTLPARFGGGANDYQLVESAAPDGRPSLILRMHPRLPACREDTVARAFVEALSSGDGAARLMGQVWLDAAAVSVVREAPSVSAGGKILHVVDR